MAKTPASGTRIKLPMSGGHKAAGSGIRAKPFHTQATRILREINENARELRLAGVFLLGAISNQASKF